MDENVLWYLEKQVDRTINNLSKRNMKGFFVNNTSELKQLLKQLIMKIQ